MPGLIATADGAKKRKRHADSSSIAKPRKAPRTTSPEDSQARIFMLEGQILESSEHHSNIDELQKLTDNVNDDSELAVTSAVALCRVFCRLIAGDKLVKRKDASEQTIERVQWLRGRLDSYNKSLLTWIGSSDTAQESTALTLLMRVVKTEVSTGRKSEAQAWSNEGSLFNLIIKALLSTGSAEGARQEFVDKYVEEHDDVRFYTFASIRRQLHGISAQPELARNALDILLHIEGVPDSDDELEDWYGSGPGAEKHQLLSLKAHRKIAREAWLAVYRSPLSMENRKAILGVMVAQVLPWFVGHVGLLTDFLTDSFNQGGSLSLLALNGIFRLMTDENIDYPDFYTKLYSLLDDNILHSKHRSRFFRLLETFMASSHLPAALVASFVKRLSRLALQAPPGGIVWIVPWVYNMLRRHPPCTFMLHRAYHPAHTIYALNPSYEEEGMDDPFDMSQQDPMLSGAIESSLWELETLRSHYHPNVSILAKIVGEQFTKNEYHLDDFLNHTYGTLIESELSKDMKKAPEVEWDIPKHIVTAEDGSLNTLGTLLSDAMEACSS